jgi:hypothetical protein
MKFLLALTIKEAIRFNVKEEDLKKYLEALYSLYPLSSGNKLP